MTTCPSAPAPSSLKEALQFAEALSNQRLEDTVGKKLLEKVKEYSSAILVKTYITSILKNLNELRAKIDNNYKGLGKYSNLLSQSDCLADTVSECFPRLYCTLCYLWYQVGNAGYEGGGQWATQDYFSSQLESWLENSEPISSPSQAKLWSGGFGSDELQCSSATDFSSQLQYCVDHGGDYFPMLFSGTLFLKPSLPDLTSTFLVFVNEICTILSGDGVRDHEVEGYGIVSRKKLKKDFEKQYPNFPDYAPLTQCCSSLKTNIEKLIGDDSSDGALRIPNSSRKMYENMLQSKNFPTYVKWLSQHIPKLIANLQKMKAECRSWNPSDMSNGQAAGPFPYGFGFSSKWSNGQEVQYDLSKLTAEGSDGLPALRSHVENLIGSSTSSSAGSIAGGLLGTAAMGGMGTAVALNVGGVTTALKGAIGIFK